MLGEDGGHHHHPGCHQGDLVGCPAHPRLQHHRVAAAVGEVPEGAQGEEAARGDVAVVGEEVRHPGEGRGHLADQGLVIATGDSQPVNTYPLPVAAQPRAGQGAHPQSRAREGRRREGGRGALPLGADHRDHAFGMRAPAVEVDPQVRGECPSPAQAASPPAPPLREPLGEEGLVRLDSLPSHLRSTVHVTAAGAGDPAGREAVPRRGELRSATSHAFRVSSAGVRSARGERCPASAGGGPRRWPSRRGRRGPCPRRCP